jgi:cytochrome c553
VRQSHHRDFEIIMLTLLRTTAFALCFVAAAPAFAADRPAVLPDTMAQRMLACTSCHAKKDVNDQYFPRISGKPAGYLYNQLTNFRDGRRQFAVMTYMVDHMSDAYLQEIATYFAAEHLPSPPPQPSDASAAVLERGRVLVLQGDVGNKIPACVACHGAKLTGVAPTIPGLLGLPRDYVNAQFGAWRNKTRRAHAPDCMADISARLTLSDVAAISSWLGLQPLPADPSPAAAIARPLPIACGSAP